MTSWVRYCVAVYIGLLISGALARPPWTTYPSAAQPADQPAQLEAWQRVAPKSPAMSPDERPVGEPTAARRASDTLTG